MEYWIAAAIIWAMCGFLAYGLTLADAQKGFSIDADKRRDLDRFIAGVAFILGPSGLAITFLHGGARHGFMWRLPPRKDG